MAYDLYPAVDENYQFPPEVRAALADSVELRQIVTLMTTTERNNLVGAELWDGRLILNTTIKRVQRYDAAGGTWHTNAEESEAIPRMTEVQRDALAPGRLIDNRIIFNTTTEELNRWDETMGEWVLLFLATHSAMAGLENDDHPQYLLRTDQGLSAELERVLQRVDTRSTELIYTGDKLTSTLEKDGTTTVKTTTMAYTGDQLTTVTEEVGGKTIVTTLNYNADGTLANTTRSVT